jgi:hypothetical protein
MKLQITHNPKAKAAEKHAPKSLIDAPAVVTEQTGGMVVVWGEGAPTGLTSDEIEAVRKAGHRLFKGEAVKALMGHKTCAQIVAHFKGRRGYSASTIRHIHAALSAKKQ